THGLEAPGVVREEDDDIGGAGVETRGRGREREAGEAEHDEGDARHGTDAMVHGSSSGSGVRRSPPPGVETGPHPGGPRVSTGDTTGDTAVRSRRTCP